MATTTNYLGRILQPLADCFTPEVAAKLVQLRADHALQARIHMLADRSTEGLLTDRERDEYTAYVRAINVITILQAKARDLLRKSQ